MKRLIRLLSGVLVIFLLATQIGVTALALTLEEKQNIERIVGVYDGSYTATQGITGLTLSIYRVHDLLTNDLLLQMYADIANKYTPTGTEPFTAEDIKTIVAQHTDEYIALFNYFPLITDTEAGVGPNMGVEEGLYTMNVHYDVSSGMYDFISSQWIQHDTYAFADLLNVTIDEDTLTGDVYGSFSLFSSAYNDVGDVSVSSGKSQSGYRIDFENESASVAIGESQPICVFVKNSLGKPATDNVRIRWTSNDESIATVSGSNWNDSGAAATITGISEGMTEIYAELENSRFAVCTVVVSENKIAAPLQISTSYELLSQISSASEGNVTTLRVAPQYRITATVKNPDTDPATNVHVLLSLPENASIQGNFPLSLDFAEIGCGSTVSAAWDIVVEAEYGSSSQAQYWIGAESDQSAQIREYKTIFVEPIATYDNRLDFDLDVWDFTNNNFAFNKGYYINDADYSALMSAVNNVEKDRINDSLKKAWTGECYGMATIVALTKIGHLDPQNYDSSAQFLRDLPSPSKSDDIYSLNTYYYETQKLDIHYAQREKTLSLGTKDQLIALVNAVTEVQNGGCPVLLCLAYQTEDYDIHSVDIPSSAAHALIAYDVEYGNYKVKSLVDGSKGSYNKRIVIYDPNDKNSPIYMYISSDNLSWLVEGYCQNPIESDGLFWYAKEGIFSFISDADILDSVHVGDSLSSNRSRLISNTKTALRIMASSSDGSEESFIVSGLRLLESAGNHVIAFPDNIDSAGNTTSYGYSFDERISDLVVTAEHDAADLDLSYDFTDVSFDVQAQNSEGITFSEDRIATVQCDGDYMLSAVYNEGAYSSPWYSYTAEGSCTGTVTLSQNEEGYTILSGDNLDGVTLTVEGAGGLQTKVLSTEATSVMLTGSDDSLVLLTDTDGDGIYETDTEQSTAFRGLAKNITLVLIVFIIVLVILLATVIFVVVWILRKSRRQNQK